jgi:AbrB family looped-hinge helix DNA binding protein
MPADDASFKTKLSTKGQVVLPKEVRRRLNWEPGDELVVEETRDGVLLKRAPLFEPTRLEDVAGCLHRPGMRALSVEEMDAAIEAEIRRQHARGRY